MTEKKACKYELKMKKKAIVGIFIYLLIGVFFQLIDGGCSWFEDDCYIDEFKTMLLALSMILAPFLALYFGILRGIYKKNIKRKSFFIEILLVLSFLLWFYSLYYTIGNIHVSR